MTRPCPLPSGVRRILVAHGLGATALGLPWPGLLVAVWDDSHSNGRLGLTGAARMAPYVLLSWLAGRVADRLSRGRLVRANLAARVAALVATALRLAGDHAGAAVACACLTVALGTPAYPAIVGGRGGQRDLLRSGHRPAPSRGARVAG
jgi:MFS family permease